jgi:hypothetical protein
MRLLSWFWLVLGCGLVLAGAKAQPVTQRLVVAENGRFLMQEDGTPFFWLADTAWELFHRCDRDEIDHYLRTRAGQGFNVVQAVALAELNGLHDPNPYGAVPLIDADPARPNPAYFEHIDYAIDRAAALGIYVALLPTWGDKVFTAGWGVGPEVFTPENARTYGEWLGKRYRNRPNVVWIIGGDRNPREGSDDVAIWRSLAAGILAGVGDPDRALLSFHPQPRQGGGSSHWFHEDDWLDFNMHQTGHCAGQRAYAKIQHDYALQPVKPTLDGEPLYEDHPNCFNARELGYSVAEDIRRIMYRNVFAGGCGQSYGCHAVWQMFGPGREPVNGPLRPWPTALDLPMAHQAHHLKDLMLSRPYFSRIPDQELLALAQAEDEHFALATRDESGAYAMIYFPTGRELPVRTGRLSGDQLRGWWYDPRTGYALPIEPFGKVPVRTFRPPSSGWGNDWVLVIDDASRHFGPPGQSR